MTETRKPTLQTVADALGVSRSTVSNAYNRPDQLSPELRDRILSTAAEIGYAGPDPTARSLRQGTAGAIGLVQDVLWAVTDPANLLMLAGVAEVCDARGLALVLLGAPPDEPDQPDPLRAARLDGVILHCSGGFAADRLRLLADRGTPFVVVDDPGGIDAPRVSIAEEHGAEEAARHLAALGHDRVAVLAIEDDEAELDTVATRRLDGYRAGLAGLEPVVVRAGWTRASGRAATAALLAATVRPTAILAMSDELALGALDAADAAGLSVPGDLSVVGYDDSPSAAAARPPLTTVHQDLREKGRAAAHLLLDEPGARRSVLLPTHLVVRASTGPVPPSP